MRELNKMLEIETKLSMLTDRQTDEEDKSGAGTVLKNVHQS